MGPYQIGMKVEYEVTVTLHVGQGRPRGSCPSPPRLRSPSAGTAWYRGDLHVHTVHSDGSQTQASQPVIGYAKAAGVDFIGASSTTPARPRVTWGPRAPRRLPGDPAARRSRRVTATGTRCSAPAGTWSDWRATAPEDGEARHAAVAGRRSAASCIAALPSPARLRLPRWDFWLLDDPVDAHRGAGHGPWDGRTTAAIAVAPDQRRTVNPAAATPCRQQLAHHRRSPRRSAARSLSAAASSPATAAGHSWISGSRPSTSPPRPDDGPGVAVVGLAPPWPASSPYA